MDDSHEDCLADRLPLADRAAGRKCSSALTDEQLRATLRSYLLSIDLLTTTSNEARTHVEQKLGLTIPKGEQRQRLSSLCVSVTKAILKEREGAAEAVPVLQASTDDAAAGQPRVGPGSDSVAAGDAAVAGTATKTGAAALAGAAAAATPAVLSDEQQARILASKAAAQARRVDSEAVADDEVVVTRTTTAAEVTDADDVVVTSVRTREERDAELTYPNPYPNPTGAPSPS